MSAFGGGVPRFNPDVTTNFRAIPTLNATAPAAAAHMLDGLGGIFNEIADGANHLQQQHVENQALQAGQAAGSQEGFDANTLDNSLTIAGQAYRKGALQTYASQLEMSRDTAFNKIQTDYLQAPEAEQSPEILKSKFASWIDGTAATLPDTIRPAFLQMARDKANPIVFDATQTFLQGQKKTAAASTQALFDLSRSKVVELGMPKSQAGQKALNTYILQGQAAIQAMDIPEADKELKTSEFLQTVRQSRILGGFMDAADKVGFMGKFLETDTHVMGLPDLETKNKMASQMHAFLSDEKFVKEANTAALTQDQQLDISMRKKGIEDAIDKGDPSVSQKSIMDFFHANPKGVSSEWTANAITKINEVREKARVERGHLNDLSNGLPFDPKDAATQGRLEKIYARMLNPEALNSPSLPVPGAVVTSNFGLRKPPNAAASTDHHGVDYAAPVGTPISPNVGGKVVFAGVMKGYGNVVKVEQDDGYTLLYGHNSRIDVKQGDKVAPGQTIALVGQSGNATGPHSHIEVVDPSGRRIDPAGYFNKPSTKPPVNPDDRLRATMAFVQKYRYIPEAFKNETVGLLYGNPQQIAEGARRIQTFQDNHASLEGFRASDIALGVRVASDLNAGISPEKAVEMAKAAMDPANANLIEGNKKRVDGLLQLPENLPDKLFDTEEWFGAVKHHPELPYVGGVFDNYHADWKKAFSDAFIATGHEEAARKLATEKIKKNWGITNVDGSPRLMKYPPEKAYALQGAPSDWIQKQLYKAVEGHAKPGNIMLVADTLTSNSAVNQRPHYGVFVKKDQGAWAPLVVNGKTQRFAPDPGAVVREMKAALVKAQAVELNKAQRLHQHLAEPWHAPKFSMTGG